MNWNAADAAEDRADHHDRPGLDARDQQDDDDGRTLREEVDPDEASTLRPDGGSETPDLDVRPESITLRLDGVEHELSRREAASLGSQLSLASHLFEGKVSR